MSYCVHPTTYEQLESVLNSLPTEEEVFTIVPAGSQVVVVTKKLETSQAASVLAARQRLLENMTMRSDHGEIN